MRIGAQAARKIASAQPLASFVDAPNIPPASTSSDADFDQYVTYLYIMHTIRYNVLCTGLWGNLLL